MASIVGGATTIPFSPPQPLTSSQPRRYPALSLPQPRRGSFRPPTPSSRASSLRKSPKISPFLTLCVSGEAADTEEEVEEVKNTTPQGTSDDEVMDEIGNGGIIDGDEQPISAVLSSLQSYKEALANNDSSTIAGIEKFLSSIEEEKNSLAIEVASLTSELSSEKDRILRISADFDNFRKRTEREKLSLVENVQGEVIESLLPVLDNFERAKDQIKVENEGEEKINNSYQSIYKQFTEILSSIGVVSVETVGNPFDPMLHEAIMRDESSEYVEGIILQEFRKGFKIGDRLLRPSMVKVSAGPGPAKLDETSSPPEGGDEASNEDGGVTDTV